MKVYLEFRMPISSMTETGNSGGGHLRVRGLNLAISNRQSELGGDRAMERKLLQVAVLVAGQRSTVFR